MKRLLAGNKNVSKLASSHLLGMGQPIHVANMAVYLASDRPPRLPRDKSSRSIVASRSTEGPPSPGSIRVRRIQAIEPASQGRPFRQTIAGLSFSGPRDLTCGIGAGLVAQRDLRPQGVGRAPHHLVRGTCSARPQDKMSI